MKTKNIFLFHIFGLLFFLPTLFIFYNGFNIIKSVNESRDWEQIDAQVIDFKIIKSQSKKSSIKLDVLYKYQYKNKNYENKKIDFSVINISFNRERINNNIDTLQKKEIKIWINPKNPNEAVINKDIPIDELNFTSIFLFTFGFLGFSWFFGLLTDFKKSTNTNKVLLCIPFLFGMLCPINILIYWSIIGFKTIILNITIIILNILWYKISLKYVK